MNETIQSIMQRRTIRSFRKEQIEESQLEKIIEAGLYAPCAGGRQSVLIAVCQDDELNHILGTHNASAFHSRNPAGNGGVSTSQPSIADDPNIKSGFYGAPTVITLLAPKGHPYSEMDCATAAQNIMLAAHSMGIGSCYVGRAADTFTCEQGQEVLRRWEISNDIGAFAHVVLGYPDTDKVAHAKPRKDGRIRRA